VLGWKGGPRVQWERGADQRYDRQSHQGLEEEQTIILSRVSRFNLSSAIKIKALGGEIIE